MACREQQAWGAFRMQWVAQNTLVRRSVFRSMPEALEQTVGVLDVLVKAFAFLGFREAKRSALPG